MDTREEYFRRMEAQGKRKNPSGLKVTMPTAPKVEDPQTKDLLDEVKAKYYKGRPPVGGPP